MRPFEHFPSVTAALGLPDRGLGSKTGWRRPRAAPPLLREQKVAVGGDHVPVPVEAAVHEHDAVVPLDEDGGAAAGAEQPVGPGQERGAEDAGAAPLEGPGVQRPGVGAGAAAALPVRQQVQQRVRRLVIGQRPVDRRVAFWGASRTGRRALEGGGGM